MAFDARETQALIPNATRTVVGLRRLATNEVIPLDGSRWVIGTSDGCDIIVNDSTVSGRHCVLDRKATGAIVVHDLKSRNGTYIDGNRVETSELRVNGYFSIGRTTYMAIGDVEAENPHAIDLIRGKDPTLLAAMERAQRSAGTDFNVLILGETGTGKDLMARAIHESSRRASGPFVPVNCGVLSKDLIASHLFGHDKGSFTGAGEARDGYFVEAHGGTLFLDEIGELPIDLQPNLLRVLETRRVRRIGGSNERPVDVRIVAATNQTAGLGLDGAKLRADLYFRLAGVVLDLPPLRERMADLAELVEGFLLEFSGQTKEITKPGWDALTAYSWPGNVRELRAAVQRAVALGGEVLGPLDFFTPGVPRMRPPTPIQFADSSEPYHTVLKSSMEQALQSHRTIRAAATALGMPKSTFADKARAWKLMPRRRVRVRNPTKK